MSQSNFKVETHKAKYNCEFQKDRWTVFFQRSDNSMHDYKGEFILPENWANTMVFQFIDGIDSGLI